MARARRGGTRLGAAALMALASAGTAAGADLWVAPTHGVAPTIPATADVTWPVTSSGIAVFAFAVPDDFDVLQAARLVVLPTATGGGVYSAFAEVKRGGELTAAVDVQSVADVPFALDDDVLTEVDVSAVFAGLLDPSSAGGDYASLVFFTPDLTASTRVVGLRLVYAARLVETARIADGAVTSDKILDGTVSGADVEDGTITGEDVQDHSLRGVDIVPGSLTGIQIADGYIRSQDLADRSISPAKIQADAVEKDHIAPDSVGASELIAGGEFKAAHSDSGIAYIPDDGTGPHLGTITSGEQLLNVNQSAVFNMTCPPGWLAIGGGYDQDRIGAGGARLGPGSNVNSLFSFPTSPSGWRVGVISRDQSFPIATKGVIVCVELQ